MIFFRILKESFQFAWHALVVNKLRTILSLLGITIGIFTIVSVFTVVDSLERNIRSSVSDLGSDVVYIQKWPWGGGGDEYPWWKYFQRPEPSYREFRELKKRSDAAGHLAFAFGTGKTLKYQKNTVDNTQVLAASYDYYQIWPYELQGGRYFSPLEASSGSPVVVLGSDVAEGLFAGLDPIGKEVKMMGRKLRVIGVFKKQGKSMVGQNIDELAVVPVNFMRGILNVNNQNGAMIMAKTGTGVEMQELKDELEGHMRSIRRLKPKADDSFALNEISVLSAGLDSLFQVIGIAGWVIGGFSILVGGFGIANIMFVSVKERTNQIGIQKSLGAKNHFILLQFLFESILLCLFGGLLGLAVVFGLMEVLSRAAEFDLRLSLANIIQGITISIIIGLISGFLPAYSAARLNPVDAIRAGG